MDKLFVLLDPDGGFVCYLDNQAYGRAYAEDECKRLGISLSNAQDFEVVTTSQYWNDLAEDDHMRSGM
jgi:hypothetical protein